MIEIGDAGAVDKAAEPGRGGCASSIGAFGFKGMQCLERTVWKIDRCSLGGAIHCSVLDLRWSRALVWLLKC